MLESSCSTGTAGGYRSRHGRLSNECSRYDVEEDVEMPAVNEDTGIPLSPNYHHIFARHYNPWQALSIDHLVDYIYSSFHLQMPQWNIRVLNAHAFDNPPPTLICSICGRHFSSRGGRTKHIKTHLANELNLHDSSNPQPPPIPNSSQPISKTPSTSSSTTNHSPNFNNLDDNWQDHDSPDIRHPENELEDFLDQLFDPLQHDT